MLNSVNCSTVICSSTVEYLCSWEKPLVKPMPPGSIFHHINLPTTSYFWRRFYFTFFTLHLYHKNTKNIILSYLSDLTLVSDRVGIDNPLSRWLRGFICLCRCEGLVRGLLLDWYLGSQKLRAILTLLCCITLSSSRENQRSAQEVARRISGAIAGEVYAKVNIPSTHHNPLSPALHYLPFASRFPLPHLTLAVLFALSFPFASFSLAFCLLVCWIACLSRWLKIVPNYVTLPIPTIMISLAPQLLLLPILNLVQLMLLCWILSWKINSPAFLVKMPPPI